MNIGLQIKAIRKQKRVTQVSLAVLAGITQTYLSQIETGVKIPTIETLLSVSKALGVKLKITFE